MNYEIPAFGRQRLEDPESQAIVPSTPKFPITSQKTPRLLNKTFTAVYALPSSLLAIPPTSATSYSLQSLYISYAYRHISLSEDAIQPPEPYSSCFRTQMSLPVSPAELNQPLPMLPTQCPVLGLEPWGSVADSLSLSLLLGQVLISHFTDEEGVPCEITPTTQEH